MVSRDSGKVLEFEGLRAIAILSVMLHHFGGVVLYNSYSFNTPLTDWTMIRKESVVISLLSVGGFGVYFFFMLSGYVVAQSLLGNPNSPRIISWQSCKVFLLKRIVRLSPPFMIFSIFVFIVGIINNWWLVPQVWLQFISGLFYLSNIVFRSPYFLNDVGWSLEVEMQFYLLFVVILFLGKKINLKVRQAFLGLFVLGVLTEVFFDFAQSNLFVLKHLPFFSVGALIWLSKDRLKLASPEHKTLLWDLISLLALVILYLLLIDEKTWVWTLMPTTLIFIGCLKARYLGFLLKTRFLLFWGSISYSAYLLHLFIFDRYFNSVDEFFFSRTSLSMKLAFHLIVGVVIVAIFSKVYSVTVERWGIKQASKIKY